MKPREFNEEKVLLLMAHGGN